MIETFDLSNNIIPSIDNTNYQPKPKPITSRHGVVNTKYNEYINNAFNEYPGLKSFSTPSDYLPMDATGKMLDILNKNKFGLEFQNRGESDYKVGNDTLALDNINKHRIYINPNIVNKEQAKDAIKLDMVSHAFHNNPAYNQFSDKLKKDLENKYGSEMVAGNGGADAYVRGYLSNSSEYTPYKKELSFLPQGYFNELDSMLKSPKK